MRERIYSRVDSWEEERPEHYFKMLGKACPACGELSIEFCDGICLECGDKKVKGK